MPKVVVGQPRRDSAEVESSTRTSVPGQSRAALPVRSPAPPLSPILPYRLPNWSTVFRSDSPSAILDSSGIPHHRRSLSTIIHGRFWPSSLSARQSRLPPAPASGMRLRQMRIAPYFKPAGTARLESCRIVAMTTRAPSLCFYCGRIAKDLTFPLAESAKGYTKYVPALL